MGRAGRDRSCGGGQQPPERAAAAGRRQEADGEPLKELLPSRPPVPQKFAVKDPLSYANILRSRNKFTEALVLYESVLIEDGGKNVEALIGKGICLETQKMMPQAFESFSEAILLEPRNAVTLTHYRLLYKEGGHFAEAVEKYSTFLSSASP